MSEETCSSSDSEDLREPKYVRIEQPLLTVDHDLFHLLLDELWESLEIFRYDSLIQVDVFRVKYSTVFDQENLADGINIMVRAAEQSRMFIAKNPTELGYQMFSRLIDHQSKYDIVKRYLASLIQNDKHLELIPLKMYWPGLEGPNNFEYIHTAQVTDLCTIDNPDIIIFGDSAGLINALDKRQGKVVKLCTDGKSSPVLSVSASRDGRWVVSNSLNHTCIWDFHDESPLKARLIESRDDESRQVAISGDGRLVVSGCSDKLIRLREIAVQESMPKLLRGHSDGITCLSLSGNGRWLVSGSSDKTVMLWDTEEDEPTPKVIERYSSAVSSVAISEDGRWIVSRGSATFIRVWDTQESPTEHKTSVLQYTPGNGCSVVISRDGRWVVSGIDRNVYVWDLHKENPLPEIYTGHLSSINTVSISAGGCRVVSGSLDFTIREWNIRPSAPKQDSLAKSSQNTGFISSAAISLNSRWIATKFQDCTIHLWDSNEDNPHPKVFRQNEISGISKRILDLSIAISASGRYIVSSDKFYDRVNGNLVAVWDTHSINPLKSTFNLNKLASYRSNHALAVSCDGRWVAVLAEVPGEYVVEVREALKGSLHLILFTTKTTHPGLNVEFNLSFTEDGYLNFNVKSDPESEKLATTITSSIEQGKWIIKNINTKNLSMEDCKEYRQQIFNKKKNHLYNTRPTSSSSSYSKYSSKNTSGRLSKQIYDKSLADHSTSESDESKEKEERRQRLVMNTVISFGYDISSETALYYTLPSISMERKRQRISEDDLNKIELFVSKDRQIRNSKMRLARVYGTVPIQPCKSVNTPMPSIIISPQNNTLAIIPKNGFEPLFYRKREVQKRVLISKLIQFESKLLGIDFNRADNSLFNCYKQNSGFIQMLNSARSMDKFSDGVFIGLPSHENVPKRDRRSIKLEFELTDDSPGENKFQPLVESLSPKPLNHPETEISSTSIFGSQSSQLVTFGGHVPEKDSSAGESSSAPGVQLNRQKLNVTIIFDVESLTPLGLSTLFWILPLNHTNKQMYLDALKMVMEKLKLTNCLSEKVTGIQGMGRPIKLVMPLTWAFDFGIDYNFIIEHSVFGDRGIRISKIRRNGQQGDPREGKGSKTIRERLFIDIKHDSAPETQYRLYYRQLARLKWFRLTSVTPEINPFGIGLSANIERTNNDSTEDGLDIIRLPLLNLNNLSTIRMVSGSYSYLFNRLKWLESVLGQYGLFPRGTNTRFLETFTQQSMEGFPCVPLFGEQNCKIHKSNLKRTNCQQYIENDCYHVVLVENDSKGNVYHSFSGRLDEDRNILSVDDYSVLPNRRDDMGTVTVSIGGEGKWSSSSDDSCSTGN